jgi:hypothetical protein
MLEKTSPRGETVPAPPNPEQPPLAPHDPTDPGPQDWSAERARQQRELLAVGIALHSHVLKICARHNRIYCDPGADLGAAFTLALQTFRRRGSEARIFADDEHALLDLLSAKIGEADDRCPRCEGDDLEFGAAERGSGAEAHVSYA